ncbi:MAG TPA: hypothetical protein VLK22_03915 [Candidatus Udaeobacter sp.]|nr:hypothetical protein [Candidatus Udaeobacter sp.]
MEQRWAHPSNELPRIKSLVVPHEVTRRTAMERDFLSSTVTNCILSLLALPYHETNGSSVPRRQD